MHPKLPLILTLLAGAVLAAGLTACGGGNGSGMSAPAPPPSSSSSPPSQPPPTPSTNTDVTTYRDDVARTGSNLTESVLTPADVNSSSFGLLRILSVDGKVDAQPLYLSHLTIGGAAHDVVFVATENDSVYAFDAQTGATLWHVSVLGSGETPSDDRGCSQITPVIGITSTPVIDKSAGPHGAIFVVAMSKNSANYYQRLHALDVTTGAELFNGPTTINPTYSSSPGGLKTFSPGQYAERAALLLENHTIYTSWTSHCDIQPYSGWVVAFSESTLAETAVINVAADSDAGPSIWMSGGGLAADSTGNIYAETANGAFDTVLSSGGMPQNGDYGNSFLKLSTAGGGLAVADYFAPSDEVAESAADVDLGSGGATLLPDMTDAGGVVRHLLVGAGKDGRLYVLNRDNMGKFSSSGNAIWQELDGLFANGIFSTPAYFNGTLYYGEIGATLKAFPVANAKVSSLPASESGTQYSYPGTAPAVSANGTSNGIVWAVANGSTAVLHAYDATDLTHELYNSTQAAGGRDNFGAGNKFITPTIADGMVFVGTPNSVAVFGER
ncbi:MAG TPA: PQQ-binding-like beta-propeller repeat protein [Steroidobacteraceae bacterium]|nr:PQQ-binding-like beta-propeller repeat protein [Steroidobacteraceae bacterium]